MYAIINSLGNKYQDIKSEHGVAAALEAKRIGEKYSKDFLSCDDLVEIMKVGKWCGQVTVSYNENGKQIRKTTYGSSRQEVAKKLLQDTNVA